MTAFKSTQLRTAGISRACVLAGLLMVGGGCALAGTALGPPAGYSGAVRVKHGAAVPSAPCMSAPPPFTAALDFPSKYEGSGTSRDVINPEADALYRRSTQPITDMEKGFSGLVTKYMATGDPARLKCAIEWLSTWADARALEGDAPDHTGRSLRKWSLASLSSAYLRLKFSSSTPLRDYPQPALRIDAWLGEIADRVKREWPPGDPLAKFNNHYYWAAWAMMATAVATNRQDLFDQAVAIYHVFAGQVTADGYLPNELARASLAAEYHSYALEPIAMVAAFGKANGVDLAAEGADALTRLAQRVQIVLDDPASIEAKTGVPQKVNATDSKSAWAWLEPYCWTVACTPEQQSLLSARRPLAVTRLGGDLSAVFSQVPQP